MLVGTLRNEQRTLWTIFHSSRSLCGQKQPLGNTTLPPTHPTELSLSLHGIFNPFDCPVRQTGACLKCQVRGGKKGRRFANMTVVHQHGQSARVHQHASTKGLDATPPSLPPPPPPPPPQRLRSHGESNQGGYEGGTSPGAVGSGLPWPNID